MKKIIILILLVTLCQGCATLNKYNTDENRSRLKELIEKYDTPENREKLYEAIDKYYEDK